ncbi:hypothetical protein O0557_02340 [Dickeya solani]|nr:hypothetical protein [Dickeya solani]MCZ0801639.1 hypothetical protein [Dickeya solani]
MSTSSDSSEKQLQVYFSEYLFMKDHCRLAVNHYKFLRRQLPHSTNDYTQKITKYSAMMMSAQCAGDERHADELA